MDKKGKSGEYMDARAHVYRRLRHELKLTCAQIGKICNRNESTIRNSIHGKYNLDAHRTHKTIEFTTWLSVGDHHKIRALAVKNNVSVPDMAHGILVDCLVEEFS